MVAPKATEPPHNTSCDVQVGGRKRQGGGSSSVEQYVARTRCRRASFVEASKALPCDATEGDMGTAELALEAEQVRCHKNTLKASVKLLQLKEGVPKKSAR